MENIKIIGVVGSGQMGSGIAQVAAMAGCKVWLYDISHDQLKKAFTIIEKSLTKFVEKNKISLAVQEAAIKNLNITSNMGDLSECGFVIEAATEDPKIKTKIFSELDKTLSADAVLASNTSSISIGALAAATRRADKVIGMHFMNPVPLMECVEVICAASTSKETHQKTLELAKKMGKTPVSSKDSAGFVVNRILMPMINEAVYALEENLSSREEIDLAMKISCNFPMGPLTLADFIGLDTCLYILEMMQRDLKNNKFQPAPLLKKYVAEGKWGRKTGEGFYKY